jgi:hypothetical protein
MLFHRIASNAFMLLEGAPGAAGGGAPAGVTSPSAPATQAGAKPATPSSSPGQNPGAKQTGGAPAQAGNPKAAPAQADDLYEVKVNGKVHKLTREQMIQNASLGFASDQRFQEAAKLKKQADTAIGKLRDPKQVINALQDPALGLNRDQIREAFEEWYAAEFIDAEQLSPEQKELREAKRKLQEYANRDKQTEEEKAKAQVEAQTTEAREQIQGQIIEALESGKLPRTNFTIRRLAYWMNRNHANGFNAPTEVLIGQVKNELQTNLRDLVESSDGDVLIQVLGENVIQKLRKYDLEQLRKLREGNGGGGNPPSSDDPAEGGQRPTYAEVQKRIRELQRTGQY